MDVPRGDSSSERGEFFATYRPDNAVIADARATFSAWLAQAAPGSRVGDEMAVVLSELLPNAISASRDGHSAVAVRAWIDGGLALEVTNSANAAFDPGTHWDYEDPLRPGGRGLVIVESSSTISPSPHPTTPTPFAFAASAGCEHQLGTRPPPMPAAATALVPITGTSRRTVGRCGHRDAPPGCNRLATSFRARSRVPLTRNS